MLVRGAFCDACGHPTTPASANHPSKCRACKTVHYANPIPVVIVVQPVRLYTGGTSIVLVRRSIAPAKGRLILPGGYMEQNGDWRVCAQKELAQEAGIHVALESLTQLWWRSPPEKHLLLLFCIGTMIYEKQLPEFCPLPNEEGVIETSGRVLATSSEDIPWSTHREAFEAGFARFTSGGPAFRNCHS